MTKWVLSYFAGVLGDLDSAAALGIRLRSQLEFQEGLQWLPVECETTGFSIISGGGNHQRGGIKLWKGDWCCGIPGVGTSCVVFKSLGG